MSNQDDESNNEPGAESSGSSSPAEELHGVGQATAQVGRTWPFAPQTTHQIAKIPLPLKRPYRFNQR